MHALIAAAAAAVRPCLTDSNGWEHAVPKSFGCWHAGATQEALVEQYNDQLRELREAGLSEQAEEVREALRALRDEERAPESSVKVRLPFSVCVLCRYTMQHQQDMQLLYHRCTCRLHA